jgi:hypothetical protein
MAASGDSLTYTTPRPGVQRSARYRGVRARRYTPGCSARAVGAGEAGKTRDPAK